MKRRRSRSLSPPPFLGKAGNKSPQGGEGCLDGNRRQAGPFGGFSESWGAGGGACTQPTHVFARGTRLEGPSQKAAWGRPLPRSSPSEDQKGIQFYLTSSLSLPRCQEPASPPKGSFGAPFAALPVPHYRCSAWTGLIWMASAPKAALLQCNSMKHTNTHTHSLC